MEHIKKMKILIANHSGPIPVQKYGGTERVIWGLGKELAKLGHEVTYLTPKGSSCEFAKIIIYNPDVDLNEQIPNDIDVVHFNFIPNVKIKKPYLTTMHGNPSDDGDIDSNTVFISKNQAKRNGSTVFVYNGLDWNDYPSVDLSLNRSGLNFLGKSSLKVKNVFGAAKIALKTKSKLHVIGGERWSFRNLKRGFKYTLNPNIIFHGMVDNTEKINIIKRTKALIFPVLWHEPFGLAIIENMYAGCAVFGTKNGALEELITPEVGFTGNSTTEIANAVKSFDYNPKRCHDYAVKNFNSEVMTKSYLQLYKKVISGESLHTKPPKYINSENTIPKFN